jgi:Ca2+-binding RTX toxin-like protein
LFGNAGNDILYGENGNDQLDGGSGLDRFYGGSGADQFIFNNGDFAGLTSSTADRIHDFSQAESDIIRLDGVDANSGLAGDQGFAFIGSGAFSHTAGELRYAQISGNTYVQGDTDGDGQADFWIRLDGLHSLVTSDFVL